MKCKKCLWYELCVIKVPCQYFTGKETAQGEYAEDLKMRAELYKSELMADNGDEEEF